MYYSAENTGHGSWTLHKLPHSTGNTKSKYHTELLSFLCMTLPLLMLGVVVEVESILRLVPLSCSISVWPRRGFPFFSLIFHTPTAPKVTTSPQRTNSTMLDLSRGRGASVSVTSSVEETREKHRQHFLLTEQEREGEKQCVVVGNEYWPYSELMSYSS